MVQADRMDVHLENVENVENKIINLITERKKRIKKVATWKV